ncbi:MAG TPA: chalcone isomerase family protein [bacterium]|nr:chalcone isomerase family protein [bacterium]HPS29272.1 chalcone isomerase family protein [bacterium]
MKKLFFILIFSAISFSVFAAEKVDFVSEIPLNNGKTIPFRNYAVFAPVSFSLYAVGLFVEGSETDNMKLKDADKPMAIQLVSLYRKLKMKTLMDELRRGFRYGMDHDKEYIKTIQSRIDKFVRLLENSGQQPGKYHRITFLYVPGEGTHIGFNDTFLGTIPGHDFKRALFGIWLNNNCANDELRDRMIKIRKQ